MLVVLLLIAGAVAGPLAEAPSPTPPVPTAALLAPSPAPGSGYPMDKLRFNGRWWSVSGGMATGWGQSFVAKFTGSATVRVTLKYENTERVPMVLGMYYSYRIDGGAWKKVLGPVGQGTLALAVGLSKQNKHTLEFGRSDEASYGTFTFYNLELDAGYTALMPDTPKLIYEAIGDSITAGFKVDCHASDSRCSPTQANEDQYKTYVAHLADAWGTDDWRVVARSGLGVGPVNPLGGTMLEEYQCRQYSGTVEYVRAMKCMGPLKWDFTAERQPDVITVNLGTNDFAFDWDSGTTTAVFQRNYKDFVTLVRSVHPQATIFCLCPLQYSLQGPLNASADDRSKKWERMRDGVKGAVEELGDLKIVYIPTGTPEEPWMDCATEFSDCTHPTVEGHAHFAKRLEEVLTPIIHRNHGVDNVQLV